MRRSVLALTLLASGLGRASIGCSSSSSQRAVPQTCEPDTTQACVTEDGCAGTRRCLPDGVFEQCLCDSDAGSQGGSATASGGSAGKGAGGASSANGGSTATGGGAGEGQSGGAGSGSGGADGGSGGSGGSAGSGSGTVFMDDFEDGNAQGWTANTLGEWLVETGVDGDHYYSETYLGTMLRIAKSNAGPWTDVLAQCEVNIVDFGDSTLATYVALYARIQNDENYYAVHLRADGFVELHKRVMTVNGIIGTPVAAQITENTPYTLGLSVTGSTLQAYLNGNMVVEGTDQELTSGGVAVGTVNAKAQFDNLTVIIP